MRNLYSFFIIVLVLSFGCSSIKKYKERQQINKDASEILNTPNLVNVNKN